MNNQILIFIFLLFSLTSIVSNSQSSLEFEVNKFEMKSENLVSDVYDLKSIEFYSFIGISCYVLNPTSDIELWYRTKSNDSWSVWSPMKKNNHDVTPDRTVFEGQAISKAISKIQFRGSKNNDTPIVFRLFFPSIKGENINASNTKEITCTCDEPEICGRSCWCPTCPIDPTPTPTTPTHIVIHHSAGFTTSDDFAGVVAYYYDLHVNTNGWDDIGYNYLVDANGVIYEGRGNGVQGAHFSCMNTNTLGVCVIGNYMTVAPAPGAMESLMNFLAWESCLYDIEVTEASYLPLADMDLPNVCAHRDGNDSESVNSCASGTECPGDVLYGLIPTFRSLVSEFACLQESVGIQVIDTENGIDFFPNPVEDKLTVNSRISSVKNISIFSISGKEINAKYYSENNGKISLDLRDLASGIYILQIETTEVLVREKFVKE